MEVNTIWTVALREDAQTPSHLLNLYDIAGSTSVVVQYTPHAEGDIDNSVWYVTSAAFTEENLTESGYLASAYTQIFDDRVSDDRSTLLGFDLLAKALGDKAPAYELAGDLGSLAVWAAVRLRGALGSNPQRTIEQHLCRRAEKTTPPLTDDDQWPAVTVTHIDGSVYTWPAAHVVVFDDDWTTDRTVVVPEHQHPCVFWTHEVTVETT